MVYLKAYSERTNGLIVMKPLPIKRSYIIISQKIFFELVAITTIIHKGHEYHEFDSFILQFLGRRSSWRWTQYIGLSICIVALACIGMGKIKNLYIWVETSLPLTSSQNLFYKTILSKNPPKSNIWRNWKWFWVPTDMMLPLWKNH